ncbi:hypothetical protein LCGC14_1503530 [marine sediment metagenome]|uniref:Uncharacterized protein n=1 Tax=marine sediment metagenome TaxID=412755 RepID=A0A0F9LIS0_9ZZZZ
MVNFLVILLIMTFAIGIGFFILAASATQHPEPVEMRLEAYIYGVTNGVIKLCVDVYCHTYYEGIGSISETFLIPPGTYNGSLEWTHTKNNCATDFDNVCAASGKVVVPNEKDGPLTIQAWNQYDLGAQVYNKQFITFNVEIPSFAEPVIVDPSSLTITLEDSLSIQDDVIQTSEPDPTPEPIPSDLEQKVSNLENRIGILEQTWTDFETALRSVFR